MGPATVILMFYAVLMGIAGTTMFNRAKTKGHSTNGEAFIFSLLTVVGLLFVLLFLFACSITIYTNTWDFGWVQ